MAATPSVKIIKQGPFKGGTRFWSNRYHFNGGTPADATHWHTLMDAVTAAEKLALPTWVTITEAIGYAAGSDVPVASKNYSLAGTNSGGTGVAAPSQVVALVRYSTSARTSKNHPVYLFNYYHNVYVGTANQDKLESGSVTKWGTYAAAWIAGFSDGSLTLVRAGPNGATATGSLVEEYVTHRDFPYSSSV